MGLPKITINRESGGIVRAISSNDSISGLIAYAPVPALFTDAGNGNAYKVVFSPQEAYNAGIKGDYSDEVLATATLTVTGATTGETFNVAFSGVLSGLTYTTVTLSGSTAQTATALGSWINTKFTEYGLLASVNSSTVTLSAPRSTLAKLIGTAANGVTITKSGTAAAKINVSTFSGATDSNYVVVKYHVDEFFRTGGSKLWMLIRTGATADFNEVSVLQTVAQGECRQIALFNKAAYASTDVTLLQAQATALATAKKYVSFLYAADIKDVTLSTLTNLNTLSAPNVSVIVGQAGGSRSVGRQLFNSYNYSITFLGACLGALASFKVSDSIAWVGKLQSINFAGFELDECMFANGDSYLSKSDAELDAIADKNYIFLKKFDGLAGSFISDSLTAVASSSDFFSIERNRTIDKARRLVGIALLPYLSSPLTLTADGKLSSLTLSVFKRLIESQMTVMQISNELSAFEVGIDPNQDVLTTDKLEITLKLVPVGVARFIEVNVSFVTSV